MNGSTLKVTFMAIMGTLLFILLTMTGLVIFGKITMDIYKEILTMLGIPTLIGMLVQAFIHGDINKNGIPDLHEGENDGKVQTVATGETNTTVSQSTEVGK